jgi:ATP-dependent DNA ligase
MTGYDGVRIYRRHARAKIVALNAAGQPSFHLLQNYQTAAQIIVFYAFDLLMLRSQNLMDRPLEERRELLQQ